MAYKGTPEEIKAKRKAHYEANRERIRKDQKEHYEANRERIQETNSAWNAKNKEKVKEYQKEFREENKEAIREYRKGYYAENRLKILSKSVEWQRSNMPRFLARMRRYKKTGKGKVTRNTARNSRRHRERHAWLDGSFQKEVKSIYKACQELNLVSETKHEVDHIVPIMHPEVCGLHVPWNLQIIPAKQNRIKTNKHLTSKNITD